MEALNLKLERYEGPIDLLLSLIQKHKIDIFDIPIAELTDQYLQYIAAMESYSMELSCDFIYMASELSYIKSKMLLPPVPGEDDPRKPLVDALLEYQRAKAGADFLQKRAEEFFDRFVKDPDEGDGIYERRHAAELLAEAFANLGKHIPADPEHREALFEKLENEHYYTVEEKIFFTLRFLYNGEKHEFSTLFEKCRTAGETVAVFLALLQLVGSGRVNIERESPDTADFTATPKIYLSLIKVKPADTSSEDESSEQDK